MMRRRPERKPFLVRNVKGVTRYVDTLEEALEQFASYDGYRLTLEAGGRTVVIRRGELGKAAPKLASGKTTTVYKADITILNTTPTKEQSGHL